MSNVYDVVTARIIAELEQGTVPWVKPWKGSGIADLPYNALTGRRYNGVNVLLLWSATLDRGYRHASWITFLQAKRLDGHVKKGERAIPIVFAGSSRTHNEDNDEEKQTRRRFLTFHSVFNVDQVEGLPEHFYIAPPSMPIDRAQASVVAFIEALAADIRHGGNIAAYVPSRDCILLPPKEQFATMERYFATSLHEYGHWTGHASRLDRDLSSRFGQAQYAAEELIAELTAAFLCAELSIPGQLRHPEYIGSWLAVLGGDKRAIFTAAAKATEATQYMRRIARPDQCADTNAVEE